MSKFVSKTKSLFVVIPNLNVWNLDQPDSAAGFLRRASRSLHTTADTNQYAVIDGAQSTSVEVIDEVAPEESKLLAMDESQQRALAQLQPGLRVVPLVTVEPLWLRSITLTPPVTASMQRRVIRFPVTVTAQGSGKPLAGLEVYGIVDRLTRTGIQATTNAAGVATLLIPGDVDKLEVVQVLAPDGYWSACAKRVATAGKGLRLHCQRIDLAAVDARDHFLLRGTARDGAGVVVGVIDSGVGKHRDLEIAKAVNMVRGEAVDNVTDNLGHGTHVCGIIAGRALPGRGAVGVAPGVTLNVYKVFDRAQKYTNSFHITKAIHQAVDDGCDLLNLSLGSTLDMPEVLREIQRARALGVVCLAAAGNDHRSELSYPARYSQLLAVTAMGRKGAYPRNAVQALAELAPFGTDRRHYVADFSNVGPQVGLTAPGVGIVSAYKRGYAVLDGTSMACPMATGALARLLSRNPRILNMERNQKRSDAIIKLARSRAMSLGFGLTFEGSGILM